MANYENLIKALERGNRQLIDAIATNLFLDNQGNPRQDQMDDFTNQHEVSIKVEYVDEVKCNVGTIGYKGNRYYFSPFVGGK